MGLIGDLTRRAIQDVNENPIIESGKEWIDGIADLAGKQIGRVVGDPLGVAKQVVEDIPIAIFGRQPDPVRDAADLVKDGVQLVIDTGINIFNALPTGTTAPVFAQQEGSINARPGETITSATLSGASLGDLSWLIYTANKATNETIDKKWQRYDFTETVSGYDSSTYVDAANKQVAITFEGTSPNSLLSTWVLSKDGVTDLEIGLGVIPNQVVEGYGRFKELMTRVQKDFGDKGYGISLAGHSLGGGLAEMMAGMYFLDTGVALPTLAEEAPGMLRQLKMYAEERLLAGHTIYLPSGGSVRVEGGTLLQRANQAKAIANSFVGQDFSNIVNLLTEQDPVGQVRCSSDPAKDGHVGIDVIVPALLTARECLQDIDYAALYPINALQIVTPQMPQDALNLFPGVSGLDISRIDRHLPAQSEGLWSGSSLGLYDPNGAIGLGAQIERTNGAPVEQWSGSQLNIPEVKIFGRATGQVICVAEHVSGKQNALVVSSSGHDVIYGSDNGDMLLGGSGNDVIYGGSGDNYISGGSGNAQLYGGRGNDIIYAGSGTAYLTGGGGNNLLFGGRGNDTFYWNSGNDIMYNGQAGGTYQFLIEQGARGNSQLKWQRNFTNIGNSTVDIKGAMNAESRLLFNFVDEIHFQDMKWAESGNDIIMTDSRGNLSASVTFRNALTVFASNKDQLDFKFANGSLYSGDQLYHVCTGSGVIRASSDEKYAGSLLIASAQGNDTLLAGGGSDLLFGGAGADSFIFADDFGHDALIGADGKDRVVFTHAFDPAAFTAKQNGDDLLISYHSAGATREDVLTVSNWYATTNHINDFEFAAGAHYKIQGETFKLA